MKFMGRVAVSKEPGMILRGESRFSLPRAPRAHRRWSAGVSLHWLPFMEQAIIHRWLVGVLVGFTWRKWRE